MKGLQLTGYGDPADVVIDVEASAIEPTDQYIIAGICA
jgi:hypothetical protein